MSFSSVALSSGTTDRFIPPYMGKWSLRVHCGDEIPHPHPPIKIRRMRKYDIVWRLFSDPLLRKFLFWSMQMAKTNQHVKMPANTGNLRFNDYVSTPREPPSSNRTRKLFLSQPVIFPQCGHWARFPNRMDVSKVSLSPKNMGDGNHLRQFKHRIEMSSVLPIQIFLPLQIKFSWSV